MRYRAMRDDSKCASRTLISNFSLLIMMYLHLGQDFIVNTLDVIGVFDLDTAGASRRTEEYFRHAESEGAGVDLCAPGTLPKSFLVTDFPDETINISQLSPAALKKRAERLEF